MERNHYRSCPRRESIERICFGPQTQIVLSVFTMLLLLPDLLSKSYPSFAFYPINNFISFQHLFLACHNNKIVCFRCLSVNQSWHVFLFFSFSRYVHSHHWQLACVSQDFHPHLAGWKVVILRTGTTDVICFCWSGLYYSIVGAGRQYETIFKRLDGE